jgi:hypothetical protein
MSGSFCALTMLTATRNVLWVVAQMKQGVERSSSHQPDIAAASTVPSGRTTTWYKLFTAKGRHTVSAVAPLDLNLRAINEHSRMKAEATPNAPGTLAQASRDGS